MAPVIAELHPDGLVLPESPMPSANDAAEIGATGYSWRGATPTAVRYAGGTADATVAAALDTSIVTHGDPAAGWGTALYHLMIRAAPRRRPVRRAHRRTRSASRRPAAALPHDAGA